MALIATNLSAFEPFTLSFTDRAADNKPNANKTIDVKLTLVNRYTGVALGSPAAYQHTVTNVKTNAYGMFSVVFEPEAWKNASFTGDFVNGYNNYALRIETKTATTEYKQIGVLAIGNLINNTVVTEAISGPAKSNFKITFNDGNAVAIPEEGASVEVTFAVAGFTPETIVKPIPCDGYTVRITAYDNTTGKGTVQFTRKTGTSNANAELMLIADVGNGKTTLASITITEAYYGLASGLDESTVGYETNRAKLIWIITDGGEIPTDNDIKTALNAVYSNNASARRQLELPNAIGIGDRAFEGCSGLTSVSLPNATGIGAHAIDGCSVLSSVSLPKIESIGNVAFQSCSVLSSVSLPKAKIIGGWVFVHCPALASVSFGSLITSWGASVFDGWTNTRNITLTLQSGQVWPLNGTTPVTAGASGTFGGYTFKSITLVPTP